MVSNTNGCSDIVYVKSNRSWILLWVEFETIIDSVIAASEINGNGRKRFQLDIACRTVRRVFCIAVVPVCGLTTVVVVFRKSVNDNRVVVFAVFVFFLPSSRLIDHGRGKTRPQLFDFGFSWDSSVDFNVVSHPNSAERKRGSRECADKSFVVNRSSEIEKKN